MIKRKAFLGPILFLILALPIFAGLSSEAWKVPAGLRAYKVIRVVDGDTIVVEKLGKVRYIGMNAPEIGEGGQPGDYFGPEAALANRKLVEGRRVKLEFDVKRRDRYGRILAYVYVGSTFVNAWLVEEGYAQVMTIPPNVKEADLFVKLQQEARGAERGLWAKPLTSVEPQGNQAIQMYWADARTHYYHYPWCKYAKKTPTDRLKFFKTRQEADDSGFRPCKVCKP